MAIGEFILGALALKFLSDSKPAPKTEPPKTDANLPAGGGIDLGQAGGLAGTALGGLISAVGGGGTATGGGALATSGGVVVGGTAAGESSAASGAVAGVTTAITAGEVFGAAWLAFFIIQFIIIDQLNGLRVAWLRYRDDVLYLNYPLLHMHKLELELVRKACEQLGIPSPTEAQADDSAIDGSITHYQDGGPGNDPRLERAFRNADGAGTVFLGVHKWRTVMSNPFPFNRRLDSLGADRSALKWRHLQMAARLVAARYVAELGRCARGMLSSFPNLGNHPVTEWFNSPDEVWSYPLVGGGQPDKSAAAYEAELQQLALGTFTVDDVFNAATLAAVLHAAAVVHSDPSIYFPWDPALYSQWLYDAMGLSPSSHGITRQGHLWLIDVAKYKVPTGALWLDIDAVKAGLPYQPFHPGSNVPFALMLTSLRASS